MQIKDSLGNILTEKQIEYFKDSKVRDSSGNLLVCYHGTDARFDTFDYEHMNPESKLGLGFYFTKGQALQFSYDYELACYINIMKPLYEYDDADKLAEVIQEEERLLAEGKTKNEVISAIVAKFNIDGIIGDDRGHPCIVAFNAGQIKAITNKTPTNRESINEAKLLDKPMNGPLFITEEGKFIRCPGDTHRSVLELDEYKEYKSLKDFMKKTNSIRVNDGSILSNEIYIQLPGNYLSDAQYKALESYLDYLIDNPRSEFVAVDVLDTTEFADYPIDSSYYDVDVDYIIKRIKQFTTSGHLREEYLDDERTTFATSSVYEAKNILRRNDKAYRIFYDKPHKLFLIGDTDSTIHMEMIEHAVEMGYYSELRRWQIPEYMEDSVNANKAVVAIYTPNRLIKETNGADLGEDGYNDLYVYKDFVITTRDADWKKCPLSKVLGDYKHFTFNWVKDKFDNYIKNVVELDESILLEKTRQELINKSKSGTNYKSKDRENQNRWDRRKYSSVANTVRDYNNINMDVFFKDDILEFVVKVKGETDNYDVTITFSNILKRIQQEVKSNNNKLEFKCVLRALLSAFNSDDVYVSCACLHSDTKIKLLDGTTPTVKEMCDRFNAGEKLWVYSTDAKGDFKPGEVEKVWMTKIAKEFIKVTLDSGEEILTTPEHPYMLRDGSYKLAEDLTVGQSLMPMYFNDTNGYETVKLNSKTRGWWAVYKLVAECLKSEEMKEAEKRADLEESSMPYKVAVHHADFNKKNNTPDNLKIMTANEHWQYHANLCGENRPVTEKMREVSRQNAIKINANPTENMKRARQEWLNKGIAHNYDSKWKPIQAEIMRKAVKKYHENMTEEEKNKFAERCSNQMKNLWNRGRIQTEKYWNARKHGFDYLIRDDEYNRKQKTTRIEKVLQKILEAGDIPSPETFESYRKQYYKYSTRWTAVFNTWEELSNYFNLNHKIIKIERVVLEDTPVYDIKVKEWNNFVVDAGVVLHNCPDFVYSGFNYYGVKQQYNSKPILGKAMQAPRIKNPNDDKGACCKHINLVLSNTDWMMKVASVINNYIKWCKNNMNRNYADIIFPAVYGMPYQKAIQLSIFDDVEDNGLLPTDQDTISSIIDKDLKNRDEKGHWKKDNDYRFKKKDTAINKSDKEDERQLKLDLDRPEKKLNLSDDESEESEIEND